MRQLTISTLAGLTVSAYGFTMLPLHIRTTSVPLYAMATEKITKEAQELLDAMDCRERNGNERPHLIVAQVAPSVRYEIDVLLIDSLSS